MMPMSGSSRVAGCFAGVSAGLAIIYNFPPAENSFYPRCPFYACTHLLCPGCGGTRALYELLHGNLQGALHYNALLTVLAPFVLLWLLWAGYQVLRQGSFPSVPWPKTIAVCLGSVSILFAVVRNTGIAFAL
jgi:Protein of unknown function (DUF2752)